MNGKYMIFNRRMPTKPLSVYDNYHNSKVIECGLAEAIEYVDRENAKVGGELFYYLCSDEWEERMEQQRNNCIENSEQKNKIISELINDTEFLRKKDQIIQELDNNINGFTMPIEVENNEEYKNKLQQTLRNYSNAIDKQAFKSEINLIRDVRIICEKIIKSLEFSIENKNEEAEGILVDVLKTYINHEFGVSDLDRSYAFRGIAPFEKMNNYKTYEDVYTKMMSGELTFYRARVKDKSLNEKIDKIEHIISLPYSKKNNANDLRFSSKGDVCLYLGTTSYVCSLESRWDESKQNLYMAAFKFNKQGSKLKILNLVVSEPLINGIYNKAIDGEYERELQNIMIKIFPLVIATSFTVKTADIERKEKYKDEVKFEYLLSQRLIKAIKKANIDGVAYLSRQGVDDLQYPHGVNLAIPMNDINEGKEYSDIYDCMEITEPILVDKHLSATEIVGGKESYINKNYMEFHSGDSGLPSIMSKVEYKGKNVFYGKIPFSEIDNYLVNQDYFKFN